MNNFNKFSDLENVINASDSIAIAGHMRPDGDCIGACMAAYIYLMKNFEAASEKQIDVYLESIPDSFGFLKGIGAVKSIYAGEKYDLFICLDCGDEGRLGDAAAAFESAKETVMIDHHITNTCFGKHYYVRSDASSTCEILTDLFEEEKIDLDIANALYLGIVHDTGVFKHSNTKRHTMECAGMLIDKGVNTSAIIDGTFYEKTYLQNQILGRCLCESILAMDGRVIISQVSSKTMSFYGLVSSDLDGIIDQMRVTKGVEVAILIKEENPFLWKVSMRSNSVVDVSSICQMFGGGGHVRAAGCTMKGNFFDVVNTLTGCIDSQLR